MFALLPAGGSMAPVVTLPRAGSAVMSLITLTGISRAEAESPMVGQLLKATVLHPPHHCCSLLVWPGPTASPH